MKQLLLFDIDGTLIRVNKAGREAFFDALSSLFPSKLTGAFCFSLRGVTDLGVFTAFCRQFGIPFSDSLWTDFSMLFMEALKRISGTYAWETLPGADEMLNKCFNYNIKIGLATGNTRACSRHKLSASHLNIPDFAGGFGDDSLTKTESVQKALHAFPCIAPCNVLFFGDTMSDYEAAVNAGIPFVGIAGPDFTKNETGNPFPVIEDYLSLLNSPTSSLYREIFGEPGCK